MNLTWRNRTCWNQSASFVFTLLVAISGGCAAAPNAPATQPIAEAFQAPRLEQITIDGDDADWKDNGFRLDVLSPAGNGVRNIAVNDASVRMGWNASGFIILVQSNAETPADPKQPLWKGSTVEIMLATDEVSRDMVQATLTPSIEKGTPVVKSGMRENRQSKTLRKTKMSVQSAVRRKGDGGYLIEALLPWDQLGLTPSDGLQVNLQVGVNAIGPTGERSRLIWYPIDGANFNKSRMQTVRLSEKAGKPIDVVAGGAYERLRRLRVELAAVSRYAGQTATVQDGTRVLGKAQLTAAGRLATANFMLPLPKVGEATYSDLAIYAGGQRLAKIEVDDLDRARKKAFDEAFFVFDSFVFSGPNFPKPEFNNPSFIEDAAGVSQIKTTYYDALYQPVTKPTKFGRYGAIVEAKSEQGWTIKRYYTLYRHDKPLPRDNVVSGAIELPQELGIDPAVGQEQVSTVGDGLSRAFRDNVSRNHDIATILAGLSEMPAGTGPAPKRLGVWERNGQWWYGLRKSLNELTPYPYIAKLPEGSPPEGGKWPVLIFLHGIGERGNDLKRLSGNGPLKEIAQGRALPFLVIVPQCPAEEWWSSQKLSDVLDEVQTKYPVDLDRIYLTGLSMGGFGTWAWSFYQPDRFAAIAPICGGGDALDAKRIQDLPAWVFHGGKDPTVRVEESYQMVKALRDLNGRVRFTLYPNAGHDSWTETYGNPDLYEWLLQQRRGQPAEPKSAVPGTQPTFVAQ